jgi:pyridoxine 5-phosphate synthase
LALLTVNLDLVAALREVRRMKEPDPAQAAVLAELAGADGIAIQWRRDRKYVRDRDLYILREVVKTRLILEIPPTEEIIEKALDVKPWMVTFVADHADSDAPVSGIDFTNAPIDFSDIVERFRGVGINVCFLIEPNGESVKGAHRAGASAVLINCREFTDARTLEQAQSGLDNIDNAAQLAVKNELSVHAGRGVSYKNIFPLAELGVIDEFVIGHAIAVRAVLVGYERAVAEMLSLISRCQQNRS